MVGQRAQSIIKSCDVMLLPFTLEPLNLWQLDCGTTGIVGLLERGCTVEHLRMRSLLVG